MLNMRSEVRVEIAGLCFRTLYAAWAAIHFFPKGKAPGAGQRACIRKIAACNYAREVSEVLRENRSEWRNELQEDSTRLPEQDKLMRFLVETVLEQNKEVAKELDNSTDELVMVNSDHDNFWGRCSCGSDLCNEKSTRGGNRLGKLLMQIRSERSTSSVKIGKIPV